MPPDSVILPLAVILTIPLWLLYHRIFKVIYFKSPFRQMAGELGSAFLTGWVIAGIGMKLLGGVVSAVGTFLAFLLRTAIIVVTVYMAVVFVWIFLQKKAKNNNNTDGEPTYTGVALLFSNTWSFLKKKAPYSFIVVVCVMLLGLIALGLV